MRRLGFRVGVNSIGSPRDEDILCVIFVEFVDRVGE